MGALWVAAMLLFFRLLLPFNKQLWLVELVFIFSPSPFHVLHISLSSPFWGFVLSKVHSALESHVA